MECRTNSSEKAVHEDSGTSGFLKESQIPYLIESHIENLSVHSHTVAYEDHRIQQKYKLLWEIKEIELDCHELSIEEKGPLIIKRILSNQGTDYDNELVWVSEISPTSFLKVADSEYFEFAGESENLSTAANLRKNSPIRPA